MIRTTPAAARRIRSTLEKRGAPYGCLRLDVEFGGCSGVSYVLAFEDAPRPSDKVYIQDGVKVAVSPRARKLMDGSTVDWRETLMESGFTIANPKAVDTCSCGLSFSTGRERGRPAPCGGGPDRLKAG